MGADNEEYIHFDNNIQFEISWNPNWIVPIYHRVYCRDENAMGWEISDRIAVRFHHLHGLLHGGSSTTRWFVWRIGRQSSQHQVRLHHFEISSKWSTRRQTIQNQPKFSKMEVVNSQSAQIITNENQGFKISSNCSKIEDRKIKNQVCPNENEFDQLTYPGRSKWRQRSGTTYSSRRHRCRNPHPSLALPWIGWSGSLSTGTRWICASLAKIWSPIISPTSSIITLPYGRKTGTCGLHPLSPQEFFSNSQTSWEFSSWISQDRKFLPKMPPKWRKIWGKIQNSGIVYWIENPYAQIDYALLNIFRSVWAQCSVWSLARASDGFFRYGSRMRNYPPLIPSWFRRPYLIVSSRCPAYFHLQ